MSNVIVKENETLDSALRRFKRSLRKDYQETRLCKCKKVSETLDSALRRFKRAVQKHYAKKALRETKRSS